MLTPNLLGMGLYSMSEAARLRKTPRRTLSRWVEGYIGNLQGGPKTYNPVIDRPDETLLTFGTSFELLYVRGFRNAGVNLHELRETAAKFRSDWDVPYPLTTKRFATEFR